jgi:hypothetical protein
MQWTAESRLSCVQSWGCTWDSPFTLTGSRMRLGPPLMGQGALCAVLVSPSSANRCLAQSPSSQQLGPVHEQQHLVLKAEARRSRGLEPGLLVGFAAHSEW